MKEAIGIFNGWRCPNCGRLVSGPCASFFGPMSTNQGKCKSCGIDLIFIRVDVQDPCHRTFGIESSEKSKDVEKVESSDTGWERWPKLIKTACVPVHMEIEFTDFPLLLKALKDFSEKRSILLSETVVGFAAKGYKQYLAEREVEK